MINNKVETNKRIGKPILLFNSWGDKLLIGLIILSLTAFILYPIASVLSTSFFKSGKFTTAFYQEVLSKGNLKLIKNSLFISILSSTLAAFFSLCIALFVFVSSKRVAKLICNSLLITMISPPFVSALALIMLFGRRGLITYGILGLSINPYGWQGIVLLQTISNMSLAAFMLINSFNSLDIRQVLASLDLGASPIKTLKNIVMPAVKPGVMAVLFVLFTINLADFGTPIIIGGSFKVLATEAYSLIVSTGSLSKGSAMSMLIIPPSVLAFYFYSKNMRHISNMADGSKQFVDSSYNFKIPKLLKIIIGMITFCFFAIMALKYGNILLATISNTASGKIKFTTQYIKMLRFDLVMAFVRSIGYAVCAGVIASLIGVILSYYVYRRKVKGIKIFEFIASLPYIIPGTFFGLGYIVAFNDKPLFLTGTAAIIILNLSFRQISVANKAANAIFPTIDNKIEDAARDLGASRLQIVKDIIIPSLRPAIITSFIQTFTASMTAVGAIIFLISPGKNVASVEMFKAIQNGEYGLGAILAVMVIVVTVTVNLIAIKLLNRGGQD